MSIEQLHLMTFFFKNLGDHDHLVWISFDSGRWVILTAQQAPYGLKVYLAGGTLSAAFFIGILQGTQCTAAFWKNKKFSDYSFRCCPNWNTPTAVKKEKNTRPPAQSALPCLVFLKSWIQLLNIISRESSQPAKTKNKSHRRQTTAAAVESVSLTACLSKSCK